MSNFTKDTNCSSQVLTDSSVICGFQLKCASSNTPRNLTAVVRVIFFLHKFDYNLLFNFFLR